MPPRAPALAAAVALPWAGYWQALGTVTPSSDASPSRQLWIAAWHTASPAAPEHADAWLAEMEARSAEVVSRTLGDPNAVLAALDE